LKFTKFKRSEKEYTCRLSIERIWRIPFWALLEMKLYLMWQNLIRWLVSS